MPIDAIVRRPPRVTLVNLATGERLEAWANPPQLTLRTTATWSRLQPPGADHQPLQYGGTSNRQVTDLELMFDRAFEVATEVDLTRVRTFLDAVVVPRAPGAPPPSVLFVWPGVVTLEAIVVSVDLQVRRFAVDGTALAMAATVTLEQVAPPQGAAS